MDWWRAKLLLIAAFACLDVFLGWQVGRLWVPRVAGPAYLTGSVRPTLPVPQALPVLKVETVGWEDADKGLLPGAICKPFQPLGSPEVLSNACTSPGSAADLSWYNGLLLLNTPKGVPAGRGNAAAAHERAHDVIAGLDPAAAAHLSGGQWDRANGSWIYDSMETYEDTPLFNARWRVWVGPQGIHAQRWWLSVISEAGTAQPLITPRQAASQATEIYGAAAVNYAGVAPELGYYYPTAEPPGKYWYVAPFYRIQVNAADCVYLNAFGSAVDAVAAVGAASAVGPGESGVAPGQPIDAAPTLSPQDC